MKNDPPIQSPPEQVMPRLVGDEPFEVRPTAGETNDVVLEPDDRENEGEDSLDRSTYEMQGSAWSGYLFASVSILACFFGGGREPWSKGLVTIFLALLLMLFASRRRLPRVVAIGLGGMIGFPLLAFLPASWGALPAWRKTLSDDWGVVFSTTTTPQAAITLEAWMLLAVCVLWLGWCLTRGFSDLQRRAILLTLTWGGILLCLLSIFEGARWISIPWWPRNLAEWGHGFGPFANRNHISSIAAMTSVLCCASAHNAYRRKSRLWLLFGLSLLAPLTCIFMNTSRAGLVLFFAGLTAWFGTVAMRRGFFQKLALSSALVFVIASLLVLSGGNVSKRLTEEGIASFTSGQGRSAVFSETLLMSLEAPWTGFGLGSFESVFPQYSDIENPHSIYLHPESDVLWLLAEGGLLTLAAGAGVVIWICAATGPWFGKKRKSKSGMQDRRLRNAAAIVFGLGALHGLVDVPNHGLGYASLMALLAGVCIRPRRLPEASRTAQRMGFRVAGLVMLAAGASWLAVSLGHTVLPGASSVEALRTKAANLIASGSPKAALPLLDRALTMKPMDFRLYFERARVRLMLGQSHEEAMADFTRSRLLMPQLTRYCFEEGVIWLDYNPALATVAWREVMRRSPGHNYWYMLGAANQHPELREAVWSLATTSALKLQYLGQLTDRADFERRLNTLLDSPAGVKGLEPAQRETLFQLWYQRGDRTALVAAMESNKKWQEDGWRILAEHYASNSDFKRACETAIPYLPSIVRTAPGTSTDIPTLERALLYNPNDARRGIDLFQAQKTLGDIDGALRTLEKVATIPNAPPYLQQEMAALYIMKQDFRRAWEHLREAMKKA